MAAYENKETGEYTPVIKTPAAGPRPGKGEMPKDELKTLVEGLITSSRQYIEIEITPERAKATRYYKGEPFGGEKPGRSAFVVTEVHDGVQAVLPHLLRTVFSGGERALEFRPRPTTPENARIRQDQADQATDYIQYVFAEENDGYLICEDVMKDGLIRKHGIFKWGWEDNTERKQEKAEGVTMDELALLAGDPDLEITLVTPREDGKLDAELTRKSGRAGPWICAIKPEEFIAVRETGKLKDAIFVAHQTRLTEGELIGLGVKEKDIKEHGGDDPTLKDDELAIERDPDSGTGHEVEAGKANERHLYVEGYARLDFDGDGYAELRKVCTLGPNFHIVHNDPVDDLPFSVWCPDREPHSLMQGRSWADRLMDMQRLKSQLMRHLLDSAASSLFPRKWYKEGDANLSDLMNTNLGAPIRTRSGPNAVGEFAHTFLGKELLPVLELTNDIVERRTGINKGTAGMDANALQSSTRAAVQAAVTASQAQQEMLVRGFVEQALKPMFRGLLKLYVKHKPEARVVRLRGKWVQVDPRTWDAEMDVQVNVALGSGLLEEKLATLAEIVAQQKEFMQLLGPNNPLVNYKHLRDTIAEALALRGRIDASRYFKDITDEQIQQMEQAAAQAAQNPPPSPEMQLAQAQIQIEQAKAQAKAQTDQMKAQIDAQLEQAKAQIEVQRQQAEAEIKLQTERIKMQMEMQKAELEDDRERDAKAADIQLAIAELELKYGVNLAELEITAQIERERIQSQEAGTEAQLKSRERMDARKLETTERLAAAKTGTAKRVVTRKGAAPAKPRKRTRDVQIKRGPDGKAAGFSITERDEE